MTKHLAPTRLIKLAIFAGLLSAPNFAFSQAADGECIVDIGLGANDSSFAPWPYNTHKIGHWDVGEKYIGWAQHIADPGRLYGEKVDTFGKYFLAMSVLTGPISEGNCIEDIQMKMSDGENIPTAEAGYKPIAAWTVADGGGWSWTQQYFSRDRAALYVKRVSPDSNNYIKNVYLHASESDTGWVPGNYEGVGFWDVDGAGGWAEPQQGGGTPATGGYYMMTLSVEKWDYDFGNKGNVTGHWVHFATGAEDLRYEVKKGVTFATSTDTTKRRQMMADTKATISASTSISATAIDEVGTQDISATTSYSRTTENQNSFSEARELVNSKSENFEESCHFNFDLKDTGVIGIWQWVVNVKAFGGGVTQVKTCSVACTHKVNEMPRGTPVELGLEYTCQGT